MFSIVVKCSINTSYCFGKKKKSEAPFIFFSIMVCHRRLNIVPCVHSRGSPDSSVGKESACNAGDTGKVGSIPGMRLSPWRRKYQPTPVFLPEKSHGQRSLGGYSPKGHYSLSD